MKKITIKTNFSGLRQALLDGLAHTILEAMDGNVHFLHLVVDIEVVRTASVTYSLALSRSANGSMLDTAVKEDARKALVNALRVLGVKINLEFAGNEAVLLSSGYPLTGAGASNPEIPDKPVIKLKVSRQQIVLSFESVRGAKWYLIEYTRGPVTDESPWTSAVSHRVSRRFSGFPRGSQYFFRVAAVGSDESILVYSDMAETIVL